MIRHLVNVPLQTKKISDIFDDTEGLSYYGSYEGDMDELPRVVKFSGGRTSGYMLVSLLKNGHLNPDRGDVVLFNNTAAEHPETYSFIAKMKEYVEGKYNIPLFAIEWQTYEFTSDKGVSVRKSAYRLTNTREYDEKTNPDGWKMNGEVFEEMLSRKSIVPNMGKRECTMIMKLEASMLFLNDWLQGLHSIPFLGHRDKQSRISDDDWYNTHLKHRGEVPREIYLKRKEYVRQCRFYRPEQTFSDYSSVVDEKNRGKVSSFQYVSMIGIRADEPKRVRKIKEEKSCKTGHIHKDREISCIPLTDWGIDEETIMRFWKEQPWDLGLDDKSECGNCVFCFLKGTNKLIRVRETMKRQGNMKQTKPMSLDWWAEMESKYGRNYVKEGRKIRKEGLDFVGFFRIDSGLTYERLKYMKEGDKVAKVDEEQSCDCTD